MGPTPLLDKNFDLEYVGTCCPEECYRRPPYICAWLHDSKIRMRPEEDPLGVKRGMEDSDKGDADEPRKKHKEGVDYQAKRKKVKGKARRIKLRVARRKSSAPGREVTPKNGRRDPKKKAREVKSGKLPMDVKGHLQRSKQAREVFDHIDDLCYYKSSIVFIFSAIEFHVI